METLVDRTDDDILLDVRDLRVQFQTRKGPVTAVRGISFKLRKGQTLGLVGESGSGKSVTCLSLLGLLAEAGKVSGGTAMFYGVDLLAMPVKDKRKILGAKIGTILQDPLTSLNPTMRIGEQIAEPLRLHRHLNGKSLWKRVVEVLSQVRIASPEARLSAFPHMLSGGMRQRVVAASAISCAPQLIVADEPTTALDVTTQAHFLDLLAKIQAENGLSIIFVTHDLGVVRRLCDHVAVMYAGRIVEAGPKGVLLTNPKHPYTKALLDSIPDIDKDVDRLPAIAGQPPALTDLDAGCAFRARCRSASEACSAAPPLHMVGPEHSVECWNHHA